MAEGIDKPVDMNGSYRHKVDAKGRMSLPAAFRKVLSADLVVTRNPKDECLYVFEPQAFEDWIVSVFESKFGGYDPTNALHVGLRRKLKGRANNVSVDNAGRIGITAELRGAVGNDKDVVVLGNTGYFEIWDAKRFDEQDDDIDLSLLFG